MLELDLYRHIGIRRITLATKPTHDLVQLFIWVSSPIFVAQRMHLGDDAHWLILLYHMVSLPHNSNKKYIRKHRGLRTQTQINMYLVVMVMQCLGRNPPKTFSLSRICRFQCAPLLVVLSLVSTGRLVSGEDFEETHSFLLLSVLIHMSVVSLEP